ncbi:MAG: hypothetical protein R6V86_11715 [Spirochaetia bacterium]
MKHIEYPKMVQESVVRGAALWVILLSLSGVYFGGVWIPLLRELVCSCRALRRD